MKISNLNMQFGNKVVLSDINLTVKKGERIAILGENGSGKTTLLNIINQGLKPTSGLIADEDFAMTNQNRCYIMQHETLPDEIKVSEALKLFAQNKAAYTEGLQLAERFRLAPNLNKRFSRLSGGEKQKLFLISSLQNSPEYYFLDEITTGLDYNSRNDLLTFLAEVFAQRQDTLFLVTHYIEEALKLCNRFVVLKEGRIVADLTKDELIERDYSLVKCAQPLVGFENSLIDPKNLVYKLAKTDLATVFANNFAQVVSYERDYSRNLGEIISMKAERSHERY